MLILTLILIMWPRPNKTLKKYYPYLIMFTLMSV